MNYFKSNHLTSSCRFDDSKNLCASVKLRKNRRANIKQRLLVVLFLFSLFFVFNANVSQAATVTWDGSDSTDWATDANWVGDTAPTSADDVVIDGVYTNAPTLDLALGAVTVNSLSLGANNASILTLSNANVTDNKLIV
ncbi:MAG: hypothetical protein KAI72_09265, partial [Candidatus Pacebacteria bacterium]|nr:hypothetical protein [Candidatus Paceibacterota bacterium]